MRSQTLRRTEPTHLISGADPAHTLTVRCPVQDSRVGEVVTSGAVGLGSVDRYEAFASHQVLSPRHRFQMRGVHAGTVPAEVVELQAIGDGSDQQFVAPAVGHRSAAVHLELCVPAAAESKNPYPTTTRIDAVTRMEPFLRRGDHPQHRGALRAPAVVVPHAPATGYAGSSATADGADGFTWDTLRHVAPSIEDRPRRETFTRRPGTLILGGNRA